VKKYLIATGTLVFMVGCMAYAQEIEDPSYSEIMDFFQSVKGWIGMGAMGIAAALVQGTILALRSKFVKLEAKWKLLAVSGLSVVFGVISLKLAGLDLMSCLLHASTLAALQVFGHQLISNFLPKA
jgi:hypothetical protein